MAKSVNKQLHPGMKSWVKGQSGNPKGRPPLLVRQIIKEFSDAGIERLSRLDVQACIEVLLNTPEKDLKKISKNSESPIFIRIISQHIQRSKRSASLLEMLLSRAHGKPKEEIEQTIKTDLSDMPEDKLKMMEKLLTEDIPPEKLKEIQKLLEEKK